MMQTLASSHTIYRYQYMDEDGIPFRPEVTPLELGITSEELLTGYRLMRLERAFIARAKKLQSGPLCEKIWVYAPSPLEEAVSIGLGLTMEPDDVFVPSYRAEAARLGRAHTNSIPLEEALLGTLRFWGGDERGNSTGVVPHDLPFAISVASQIPHATGIARKFQLLKQNRVVVTECGDGATSNGNFATGINLAGVWKAPVVFLIRDNKYAISIRSDAQTAAKTLAQKAIAAGIPGEQVDGNDLIAVMARIRRAITRAREGDGPTVIQLETYRGDNHTTSDDWHRYRDEAEVLEAWKKDPIPRLAKYLRAQYVLTDEIEGAIEIWTARIIEKAVDDYKSDLRTPIPKSKIMEFLFESIPAGLADEYASMFRTMGGS